MISDQEIKACAEKVKHAVWKAADEKLSRAAKDVMTAGELSALANEAESAAYQVLFRLKIDRSQ